MRIFTSLFLCFLIVWCTGCSKNVTKGDDIKPDISDIWRNDSILYAKTYAGWINALDTSKMEKKQTFDELKQEGKGNATEFPFVYIKRLHDTIMVVSSKECDSIRLYIKMDKDLWYNHLEYSSGDRREYDRYIYNDTLLEIMHNNKCYEISDIFVKAKDKIFQFGNSGKYDKYNIDAIRKNVYYLSNINDSNIGKYCGETLETSYHYFNVQGMNRFSLNFKKEAYGIWGIQPGIEKSCEIPISTHCEPSKKHRQHSSPDYLYNMDEVDSYPSFPNGITAQRTFMFKKRRAPLVKKGRKCVSIEAIVEKDGRLTSPRVINSIDYEHDKDALAIIEQMPKWKSAKIGNTKVRCITQIFIYYGDRK